MRLRAGFIGPMRDWLPSRRSVDSHRGACVMRRDGHCRSGRLIGFSSWNERYFPIGLRYGCWAVTWDWVFTAGSSGV